MTLLNGVSENITDRMGGKLNKRHLTSVDKGPCALSVASSITAKLISAKHVFDSTCFSQCLKILDEASDKSTLTNRVFEFCTKDPSR